MQYMESERQMIKKLNLINILMKNGLFMINMKKLLHHARNILT